MKKTRTLLESSLFLYSAFTSLFLPLQEVGAPPASVGGPLGAQKVELAPPSSLRSLCRFSPVRLYTCLCCCILTDYKRCTRCLLSLTIT